MKKIKSIFLTVFKILMFGGLFLISICLDSFIPIVIWCIGLIGGNLYILITDQDDDQDLIY